MSRGIITEIFYFITPSNRVYRRIPTALATDEAKFHVLSWFLKNDITAEE